jgi:hypothetical protein
LVWAKQAVVMDLSVFEIVLLVLGAIIAIPLLIVAAIAVIPIGLAE